MKRHPVRCRLTILLALPCVFLALSGNPSEAGMQSYCQVPPYVYQSVLPSVALLISNSRSMLNFAYTDTSSANLCDNSAAPCGGFDNSVKHYGLFDPNSWYVYQTSGGGRFTKQARTIDNSAKQADDWSGNFLNWLTTRRIDVMRKVLTGGEGMGYATCPGNNARYKVLPVRSAYYVPAAIATDNALVTFNQQTQCSGASLSNFSFVTVTISVDRHGNTIITYTSNSFDVKESSSDTRSGIYQKFAAQAQIEFAFFNDSDNEGGNIAPEIKGSPYPASTMLNRVNGPSNYNGQSAAPLGEALWTVTGQFAQVDSSTGAGMGTCASGNCGPRYHNGDYNPSGGFDPYTYHGAPSRCVKGNVVVVTDGEPCMDGNLPSGILTYADNAATHCTGSNCPAAAALGFPYATTIPACAAGGSTSGVEHVAFFAHTTDLRSPSFGANALMNRQNLDIYIVRAFGTDNSNLLKYAAINGTFEDANGNGVPDPGEYNLSDAYVQANDGQALQSALERIFGRLLHRATSGTAASVLASGEGSGANLVQAVFYPRRRFGNEIVEWTGTMKNLWYYIDPFFGDASIREDTDGNDVLNLVADKTAEYFYDSAAGVTKVNLFSNDSTTGKKTGTPVPVSFESLKNLWETGSLLHSQTPGSRTIFTALDNTGSPRTKVPFHYDNAATLQSYLNVPGLTDARNVIQYVRGVDDVNGDNVVDFRMRTVEYPNPSTGVIDNTVWKLGDIINSTPKIVSAIPLNKYDGIYGDTTYGNFLKTSGYKNRGMVFSGGNDGMLHAFKLGKLEFPGDNAWTSPGTFDRARLRNLEGTTPALGSERWAFVPKNALPYLQYLQDNSYCHLFYVDLPPQVFDASIGAPGTTLADNGVRTVDSWRTILIGGMRYGGACKDNTVSCTECVNSPVSGNGLSSYFAIDVTDPESPQVLWEFSDPAMGFATTGPAIVRINGRVDGGADRTRNGKWYVVVGSGPMGPIDTLQFMGRSEQELSLFVIDLKDGTLARKISTGIPNAFAGSMINATADFNLDYEDDALYMGFVTKDTSAGTWTKGGVGRLITKGSAQPSNWVFSKVIENIGPVTTAVSRLQNNLYGKNWLFFGSGRYFFEKSNPFGTSTSDDPTAQRYLYGLWDKCFNTSNTIDPLCDTRSYATMNGDSTLQNTDTATITESAANGGTIDGWKIPLDTTVRVDYDGTGAVNYRAERSITDPLATSAGVVFFTTYRPYGDDCSIGGRTFIWAVRYNTGGVPSYGVQGKALMQVSTASVEQLDLGSAFTSTVTGADASLHRGGRRSYSLEGVPPTAQGLSLLSPPPPVKRILHMKER